VSFAGSAKILQHDITGVVVDGANPVEFADAVLHLLDNPALAQRLGMNAQRLMHAEYGWEKQAEKILHIYEQVMYENSET
jgi:glycosyltransferase involved in cell wall biosynthesis